MNYGYNCRHRNDRTSARLVELDYFYLTGRLSYSEYQLLNGQWSFRKFMKSLGFSFPRQARALR